MVNNPFQPIQKTFGLKTIVLSCFQAFSRGQTKFLRGVAEALEPMDGREGPSTSGKNPGGIFERVPEKICLAPCHKLPA